MNEQLGTLVAAAAAVGFALSGLVILAAIHVRDTVRALVARRARGSAVRRPVARPPARWPLSTAAGRR